MIKHFSEKRIILPWQQKSRTEIKTINITHLQDNLAKKLNLLFLNEKRMKTVTILLCFSLIPILVFPQWHWQNPLPQGNSLESVFFTDSNTGYAVGDAGTILKNNQRWINMDHLLEWS